MANITQIPLFAS